MSLDFASLSEAGTPAHTVSISVDVHHELICAAKDLRLILLLRIEDYYQDAEYEATDLPYLAKQIMVMRENIQSSAVLSFLEQFNSLMNIALLQHAKIHVLAD
ncbi:hypothetical protein [Noviherbaspirillum sp. Root189]|uniref:hypothetical protein n=1 Tax=Noviherbaspirillum sp. Root189 TaxID=1736487 RepID=UPI000709881B|nr:hypothetical protein [Noviherbaspirillum sp. Root189]KRB76829.1 hypothetical protein ASE07_26365 [Noviherbaspirillum sp. Root189]